MERNTQVISVGNQKGGVCKTTVTVNLAAALGELGKKVLVWDLDMNQGATRHFGIPGDSFAGTFEVLVGDEDPESVILTKDDEDISLPENVHLIPAKRRLERIDMELIARDKFLVIQDVLIAPIASLRGHYDYIFLDTAPNATAPTIAAYKAADWFLLSAIPEAFAIAGLGEALSDVRNVRERGNPKLRLLGIILSNMEERLRVARTLNHYLDENGMSDIKFETIISRSTVVPTAQMAGKTLFQTHPDHKVTEQYRKLAREVEARIKRVQEDEKRAAERPSEQEELVANG